MPSLHCSISSRVHVALNWTLFLPQVNTEKVDLTQKMDLIVMTRRVCSGVRLQLQILF